MVGVPCVVKLPRNVVLERGIGRSCEVKVAMLSPHIILLVFCNSNLGSALFWSQNSATLCAGNVNLRENAVLRLQMALEINFLGEKALERGVH